MKTQDIAAVALKILGVYVFLQFVAMLPTGFGLLQVSKSFREVGATDSGGIRQYAILAGCFLVTAAVYLALALFAFLRANRLAKLFVPSPEDQVSLSGPVSDPLLTMSFQCLGVYALVTWAPSLVQTIIRCTIYGTLFDPHIPFLRRFYDNWSNLISPSVGVMAGLLLIFRAKGLLRLIRLSRPMTQERMNIEKERQ